MLETKVRKEQEQIVENPIRAAQADVSGITIVIRGGDVKYGLEGQSTPQVLIQALDITKNDILKSLAQYELEQEKVESDIPAEALEEIQNNIEKVS